MFLLYPIGINGMTEALWAMLKCVRILILVMSVLPVIVSCVVLNRYIFKSADMIGGAING